MGRNLRFLQAADNTRPYRSHRFDVFGPKIGRRLTLFGQLPMSYWVLIESDYTVEGYCERPVLIPDAKPARVVDYWVKRHEQEEFWFLLRPSEIALPKDKSIVPPAFQAWADSQSIVIKCIVPEESDSQEIYFKNWGTMIRYISSNMSFVTQDLVQTVEKFISKPRTVGELETYFGEDDPMLVRTALFSLIHSGKITCQNLDSALIGLGSTVEAI